MNDKQKEELKEYQSKSKDKLKENIRKKILTTTVGAVAQIEEFFNDNFKNDYDLMDEFDKIRTLIFDIGNKQIKNAQKEIDEYTVYWNRKYTKLEVKNNKDKGNY